MHCNGRENKITLCDKEGENVRNEFVCNDLFTGFNAAGVTCQDLCTHGEVRLLPTAPSDSMRIEVCLSGTWASVCHNHWENIDARVVCRQLNLTYEGAEARPIQFTRQHDDLVVTDVVCTGNETRLIDCQYINTTDPDCDLRTHAGVICQPLCSIGDVRLLGSTNLLEGRVEVCTSAGWGTVCDNGWNTADGRVVCRQLGHSTSSELIVQLQPKYTVFPFRSILVLYNLYSNCNNYVWFIFSHADVRVFGASKYGSGFGTINYSNVKCTGTEDSLTDCPATALPTDCTHDEDVGLRCQTCE